MKKKSFWFFLLPPLIFLLLFFLFPLTTIAVRGLFAKGSFRFSLFIDIFSDSYYRALIVFTFWQATLSTLLTLLLALPGAYIFANYSFVGKAWLERFLSLPFMLPTVVVAAAFQSLLGYKSTSLLKGSLLIVLLAHVFYNYSVITRFVGRRWASLHPVYREAAQTLGAGRFETWRRITFPLLLPSVLAASALVFIFCFTSFGVILILGAGKIVTLEVAIYRQALQYFRLDLAVGLSILQLAFMGLVGFTYTYFQKKNQSESADVLPAPKALGKSKRNVKYVIIFYLAILTFGMLLPLISLLAKSLTTCSQGLSLTCYEQLFINKTNSLFFITPWRAIGNTFAFGVLTVFLAAIFSGCVLFFFNGRGQRRFSKKQMFDWLLLLPLSISSVSLGLGYISSNFFQTSGFSSSFFFIACAHTVIAFPFVLITVLPHFRAIEQEVFSAARSLGASEIQLFGRVVVPLLKRIWLAGLAYAFLISVGEFGATTMLARPQFATIPLAIKRFLGQPGMMNYGRALAMSSLLLLVSVLGMLVIERRESNA